MGPRFRGDDSILGIRGGEKTNISLIQYPRILGAAALTGIDHQRTWLERHASQAAGHDGDVVASGQHERAQIDMARCKTRLAMLDANKAQAGEGWLVITPSSGGSRPRACFF